MAVELVTGYSGTAHVSSSEDGARQAGTVGTGMYALETVDDPLKATLENANTVTVGPGDVLINGRHVQLTGSTTFAVPVGTQGMQTSNLLVLRYELAEDETESVTAITLTGEPAASDPQDPAMATGSILDGDSPVDMPLYRVVTTGIETAQPERLFSTVRPISGLRYVRYAENAASTITGARVENDPAYDQRVNLWTDGAGNYGLIAEDSGLLLYHGEEQEAVWTVKPDAADGGTLKSMRGGVSDLSRDSLYNLPPGAYLVGQNAANAPNGETGYGNLLVSRSAGDRVQGVLSYDDGHVYVPYSSASSGTFPWKRLVAQHSKTLLWSGSAAEGAVITVPGISDYDVLLAVVPDFTMIGTVEESGTTVHFYGNSWYSRGGGDGSGQSYWYIGGGVISDHDRFTCGTFGYMAKTFSVATTSIIKVNLTAIYGVA